jgi:hypothetical protein
MADDINDTLITRVNLITEELDERLDDELSYRDELAVRTAIIKAAEAGFHVGTASAIYATRQAAKAAGITYEHQIENRPCDDLWAFEFGPG